MERSEPLTENLNATHVAPRNERRSRPRGAAGGSRSGQEREQVEGSPARGFAGVSAGRQDREGEQLGSGRSV